MMTDTEHLTGSRLVDRVRELVHKQEVRRLVLHDVDGLTLAEFPIHHKRHPTAVLAATGAIAALIDTCTLEIVRDHGNPVPELCEEIPAD